jgi:hypothetical protein
MVPLFLLWCIWREHNVRNFEDCERTVIKLKAELTPRVGLVVGQPGTLSMLLKVLGSKPIECKLLLGAIGLGVCPLN